MRGGVPPGKRGTLFRLPVPEPGARWSLLTSVMSGILGLLYLPVLVRALTAEEVGLWYVFNSLGALASLGGSFGLSQSYTRGAAYLLAGAPNLAAQGPAEACPGSSPNREGLSALYRSGLIAFGLTALAAFVLLATLGTLYLLKGPAGGSSPQEMIAWSVYSVGTGLLVFSGLPIAFLEGTGKVALSQQIQLWARTGFAASAVIALAAGGRLTVLCALSAVSSTGILVAAHLGSVSGFATGFWKASVDQSRSFLVSLWPNSWRFALTSLGSVLINSSGPLVCERFLGLSAAGSFGLSAQILRMGAAVSNSWISSVVPVLSRLRSLGDAEVLREVFLRRLVLALGTQLVLSLLCVVAAPMLPLVAPGSTRLLDSGPLVVLSLVVLLEFNHSAFAAVILAENRVPFGRSAVISGAAVILLSTTLAQFTSFGVWSVILGQGLVQIAFNNWYWVVRGCEVLGIRPASVPGRAIRAAFGADG